MIWKTECSRIKNLLALSAGHDIDEEEAAETRRHLSHCSRCREHQQKIEAAQQMLEQVAAASRLSPGDGEAGDGLSGNRLPGSRLPGTRGSGSRGSTSRDTGSIWPQVRARLLAQQARPARQTFNGWLPVGAVAAACLAILVVAETPQPQRQYAEQSARVVQPVMNVPFGANDGMPGWERSVPGAWNRRDWTQKHGGLNFGPELRRIEPGELDRSGF